MCRIGILYALSWLDEVAVSPEALSSCWKLNHVGVGFSAFLMYHSCFILPRIRILEPYVLSCLEWQRINSILEILSIGVELAFFLHWEFSLLVNPVIITYDGRIEMLDQSFLPNRISAGDGISLEIGVHL